MVLPRNVRPSRFDEEDEYNESIPLNVLRGDCNAQETGTNASVIVPSARAMYNVLTTGRVSPALSVESEALPSYSLEVPPGQNVIAAREMSKSSLRRILMEEVERQGLSHPIYNVWRAYIHGLKVVAVHFILSVGFLGNTYSIMKDAKMDMREYPWWSAALLFLTGLANFWLFCYGLTDIPGYRNSPCIRFLKKCAMALTPLSLMSVVLANVHIGLTILSIYSSFCKPSFYDSECICYLDRASPYYNRFLEFLSNSRSYPGIECSEVYVTVLFEYFIGGAIQILSVLTLVWLLLVYNQVEFSIEKYCRQDWTRSNV